MKFFSINCLVLTLGLNLVSSKLLKRRADILEIQDELEYASNECKAELENSLKCINKINAELEAKEEFLEQIDLEELCDPMNEKTSAKNCKDMLNQLLSMSCQVFESDECKAFIKEDAMSKSISSAKCESNEEEIALMLKLAAIKGSYLAGCGKTKSGDLCPLTKYVTNDAIDFIFNNQRTLSKLADNRYEKYGNNNEFESALDFGNDVLTFTPVLKDINNILVDSCNDSSCNKNIMAIDNIVTTAKAAYEKNQKTNLSQRYPKVFDLYDTYMDNFRNQRCSSVSINSNNSAASNLKKITFSFVAMISAVSIFLLL